MRIQYQPKGQEWIDEKKFNPQAIYDHIIDMTDALEPNQQGIIEYHYLEGKSFEYIVELLDYQNVDEVKSIHDQAIEKLQARMSDDEEPLDKETIISLLEFAGEQLEKLTAQPIPETQQKKILEKLKAAGLEISEEEADEKLDAEESDTTITWSIGEEVNSVKELLDTLINSLEPSFKILPSGPRGASSNTEEDKAKLLQLGNDLNFRSDEKDEQFLLSYRGNFLEISHFSKGHKSINQFNAEISSGEKVLETLESSEHGWLEINKNKLLDRQKEYGKLTIKIYN